MKARIIIMAMAIILANTLSAQTDTAIAKAQPIVKNSAYYFKKSSNQATGGYTLLAVGVIASVVGGSLILKNGPYIEMLMPTAVGILTSGAGVLCLINASKNKTIAKILLKQEQVSISTKTGLSLYSAGVQINF
jgi:hypothetical protein